MELVNIKVEAYYAKTIGENTLRVYFYGHPNKEVQMQILTTGNNKAGDAIMAIGTLEEFTEALKQAKQDFAKRFQFNS